ncbi:hypothetical protein M378DRAFT_16492 [Amanita muscaria Koide BX008]|uniref:Gag-like protein n=1 Tax=Amanita muscaria (strain Koide BX008) TaxID=946122 RepID=A0A0C2W7I7_AMAMK|nr:hypothetical protein M378DRAFT_16492 [Amanita muscaria Koide BX008]
MSPKPVARALSDTYGRFTALADTTKHTDVSSVSDIADEHFDNVCNQVSNVFGRHFPSDKRAQSFYYVFTELAAELESTPHFTAVMSRIADNLRQMGCNPPIVQPCALPHEEPCTLPHAQPCTLSHDPVTVTVTKEVHPTTCSDEMKRLRKEISDLKSIIGNMKKEAKSSDNALSASSSRAPMSKTSATASAASTKPPVNPIQAPPVPNAPPSTSVIPPYTRPSRSVRFDDNNPRPFKPTSHLSLPDPYTTQPPHQENVPPVSRNQRIAKGCTRKGTRANVLSIKGPNGIRSPASIDLLDLKSKIDANLINIKCKICSWTIHGNLSVICDRKISPENRDIILRLYQESTEQIEDVEILNKSTLSYVKFVEVPLFDTQGRPYTKEHFASMLKQNNKWANIDLAFGPEVIKRHNEDTPLKDRISSTIKIGFKDDNASSVAKKLLTTTIAFGNSLRRCRPWVVSNAARQCHLCLRWGHSAHNCRSISACCAICASRHPTDVHHVSHSKYSEATLCINCKGDHVATSQECPWFKARYNRAELAKLKQGRIAESTRRRNRYAERDVVHPVPHII